MNGKTKTTLCLMLVMCGVLAFQPVSHAGYIQLSFNDFGSNLFTVDDQGVGDVNPAVGAVTFVGTIGVWQINVSTAITYPFSGSSPSSPFLDLNSINSSFNPGTLAMLQIGVSALDYLAPGPGALLSVGGTTSGFATFESSYDTGNTFFGSQEILSSLTADTSPFAVSGVGIPFDGFFAAPYNLNITALLLHENTGTTSFNAELTVPEPGSLILLGFGLFGLLGIGRRSRG